MGHALAGQQQIDLFDALAKAGHRLVRRAAEPAKLVRQKGTREPDIEAAIADRVQHADFAGELQRMVEDRQHRTRHQPRPARALSRGGEKQHWVGAVPAVVMKIMLDDADVGEPEFLRLFHQAKRITKILGAGFLLSLTSGKTGRRIPYRSPSALWIHTPDCRRSTSGPTSYPFSSKDPIV
jgi:hypothetical protein